MGDPYLADMLFLSWMLFDSCGRAIGLSADLCLCFAVVGGVRLFWLLLIYGVIGLCLSLWSLRRFFVWDFRVFFAPTCGGEFI